MKKLVDIVMPVHNRWEHTKQTLDSLFEHTDPTQFRLWVIDDKSDDGTTDKLYKVWRNNRIDGALHVNEENIGPGASRNWACDEIVRNDEESTFLYLSDNDVFFTAGWLEKLVKSYWFVHQYHNVRLLGGGCHAYLQDREKVMFFDLPGVEIGIKDAVSGYSQLMLWQTWHEYGPLDEGMRGQEKKIAGSEDWAFCQKIIQGGFKVGSIRPEVVIHTGRTNTYGEPATGAETIKDVPGVNVK